MAGEFEELYTSTFGRLVGQLYLVTGDLHEAEEVVQEAFTRAASRWQRVREYDQPELWVRRVAINPSRWMGWRWRRRWPPCHDDSAQVVVLHYLLDVPVGEVARQLSMPVGTVKSRLARARSALAEQLDVEIDQPRSSHG